MSILEKFVERLRELLTDHEMKPAHLAKELGVTRKVICRYTNGESVTLSANGDGSVKVVFESASWGTFTIESATVTSNGEEYLFTGSGSVAMGMGESTSNYDFTLSGRTNAAKDDFSIAFNVPAVMGGLTVTLLPGTAPATEE